jgi:NAD(P)-dependent dehydrogenase (short-subunit alcohol dehydrogenase family)
VDEPGTATDGPRAVVLTGGNAGIGRATAEELARRGDRVVLGCRNATSAESAVADLRERTGSDLIEWRPLDLADLTSVRAFAESLRDLDRIDVLVANAGLVLDRPQRTAQGVEATFGTNHLGHYLLADLLGEQLRAAGRARIVLVASLAAFGGIRWEDLERDGRYSTWRSYGESKLANILHAEALTRRYAGTGVVANSLHPGGVRTGFAKDGDTSGLTARLVELGSFALISAEEGARTPVFLATDEQAGRISGRYWYRCRRSRVLPWTRRAGDVEELVRRSDELVARLG